MFILCITSRYSGVKFFSKSALVQVSTRNLRILKNVLLVEEMSNLYRGPAIDASYHVSVHLAKRFQRRRFVKIGQSETRIAYGGHVC
jgi:hypothetical protein